MRLPIFILAAAAAAFSSVAAAQNWVGILKNTPAERFDEEDLKLFLDASRKAARRVRVPAEVFATLWIYIVVTAGVLGFARSGSQAWVSGGILFGLIAMSYMLILDLDRPNGGGITEGQDPMIAQRDSMRQQPPGTFDHWRARPPGQ